MSAIDEVKLRNTTDAMVWAEEFCGTFSIYTDEGVVEDKAGLMVGWFANAIETARMEQAKASVVERERLRGLVEFLWDLLDDIDTADDMAKSDDAAYRRIAHRIQKRRWETGITTDGHTLDITNGNAP